MLVTWLGGFAGDAALIFGARGGVYLGGGIAPKIVRVLSAGELSPGLRGEGPHAELPRADPDLVILAEFATLPGAAVALRANLAEARPDGLSPRTLALTTLRLPASTNGLPKARGVAYMWQAFREILARGAARQVYQLLRLSAPLLRPLYQRIGLESRARAVTTLVRFGWDGGGCAAAPETVRDRGA